MSDLLVAATTMTPLLPVCIVTTSSAAHTTECIKEWVHQTFEAIHLLCGSRKMRHGTAMQLSSSAQSTCFVSFSLQSGVCEDLVQRLLTLVVATAHARTFSSTKQNQGSKGLGQLKIWLGGSRPRCRPIASISSMKTMHGACKLPASRRTK